jgi:23S rRNA pseudouridine1911/1915/1917 synthase
VIQWGEVKWQSSTLIDDTSILLEEASFIVLNKPTGLLSQSTFGVDSVLFQLRAWLKARASTEREPFAELPHRLDRGTSGVLLIAKTKTALACFSEQFHSRKTSKSYLVAVQGHPEKPQGEWVDWMRKIPDVAKAELVKPDTQGGRQAILEYEQLFADTSTSIHRVQMKSGRMHQIRLQFASRGIPVLGDLAYGCTLPWYPERRHDHDEHFGLHAHKLSFRHPKDGRIVEIEAPLPPVWRQQFPNFRVIQEC